LSHGIYEYHPKGIGDEPMIFNRFTGSSRILIFHAGDSPRLIFIDRHGHVKKRIIRWVDW
jgi:hypothetical protein